jgi:glutamate synthase (NADPH/NADH) small chain
MNPINSYRAFLDYKRVDPGYRRIDERVRDWLEVEQHLPDDELTRQAARCMDCGIPFCYGAGCPLKNPIPEMNIAALESRWEDALQLLLQTCPYPEFTGRVCPALCEGSCCNAVDSEPVAIRQIEREIADRAFAEGRMLPRPPGPRNGKSVAIVGSGPTGLAAASDLNRQGFDVTVYESAKHAGGLLRYGIPDFKLEKWMVERRIDLFRQEGIRFECGVQVGVDLALEYIRRKFEGVLLACGAREPRDLKVPGRELKGIHFALDFLTRQNQVLNHEIADIGQEWSAKGRDVVVIGGGDTGSDCVGTSVRHGAKSVTQIEILPKPPAARLATNPWPEWPKVMRSSSSHPEGCERMFSVNTLSFEGDESGRVYGIRCNQVEWQGRTPAGKAGTEFFQKADLVLLAMGFTGPEKSAPSAEGLPNVWAAGDMVTGPSLVVWAAIRGHEAARQIAAHLGPVPVPP